MVLDLCAMKSLSKCALLPIWAQFEAQFEAVI